MPLRKKTKSTKRPAKFKNRKPLKGSHRLLRDSFRFLKLHKKFLAKVALVAMLVNLLISYLTAGETTSIYQGLWFVFVSGAMIWAIRHAQSNHTKKEAPTLAQAYWDGTASTLKLLIILSLIAIASLPFSLGAFLFSTINYLAIDSLIADVIAGGIWLSLGLISLILLSRLSPSLIVGTLPGVNPGQAIKLSWNLTRGQTLELARRLFILFIYLFAVLALVAILLSVTGLSSGLVQLILSLLAFLVVLPIVYIYLFLLYRELA